MKNYLDYIREIQQIGKDEIPIDLIGPTGKKLEKIKENYKNNNYQYIKEYNSDEWKKLLYSLNIGDNVVCTFILNNEKYLGEEGEVRHINIKTETLGIEFENDIGGHDGSIWWQMNGEIWHKSGKMGHCWNFNKMDHIKVSIIKNDPIEKEPVIKWWKGGKFENLQTFENFINEIDPYGEEDWEYDNLSPVLQIAKKQNIPYDQITFLSCDNNQLTSLEGIENLVNLKILDCWNNQLTSLEGIENLVNLEALSCSNNQLTSLEGIENLINLEKLWCSNNQLTSLDGIENLVNLEKLWCSNNQLTSLEGVENLINLKELYCRDNQLTGLKGIENLFNLKQLWCSSNQLTSLEGIENLINLEKLRCSNNQLTSLEGIENLVNLKTLNCWNNRFSNEYKDYLRKYCEKKNIELVI
jgi:hypothetical protein